MRWRSRATSSATLAVVAVVAVTLGSALAGASSHPTDDPAVEAERDALIDKIARGEDVQASVKRFAALVKERDGKVATSLAAREAEEKARIAESEYRKSYEKSADHDLGWRCTLSVDPKHPITSDEGRFKGDWGRVVKKEKVTLAPKNALDDGEPATLYEVAGQARHYYLRGETFGAGFPPRAVEANVGDLMVVCDGDDGHHDNTERTGWRGSPDDPSTRVPEYWRGKLQRHGFAARIAATPKIAEKAKWNPIHITGSKYFWAIHDVKWKYPDSAYVLSDLTIGKDLGGGHWEITVDNRQSFVIEVPSTLRRREAIVVGHNAWLIMGHARFDRAWKKLVLVVEDVEPHYITEK
ncbi:MAG: hypothetical protein JWN44_782 [Myxococcales bacterium]|nr:hypothetical protein [Myxococcales bacterium]